MKRYYGRRKAQEDSDSELSGLEEEKSDLVGGEGARAQLRPDQGNGNGKMWSSRAKEESKALTIKEKLKRKMQQQLKKTFKVSGMDLLQNQPLINIDFIHRRIRRLKRSA